MDLNCDMGEGLADADAGVMPLITSANVACGYHAGDPATMERTVALARKHGVAVGAHPGYPDRAEFGRRQLEMSPEQVELAVLYQIGALAAFCRAHRVPLVHVKPHGALYNAAAADPALARAVARAAARFDRELALVGLASSAIMAEAAADAGLAYAPEAFADRVYNPDGTLQARSSAGSLIAEPMRAGRQAAEIAQGYVTAHDGSRVPIAAFTLCIHGDNPAARDIARDVRAALAAVGVAVEPLWIPRQ